MLRLEPANRRLFTMCFAAVFAALATLLLSISFAATAQTSFSGSLSKKQPMRSHSITTTVSGTILASASTVKASAPLTLKLKQGNTLIAQSTSTSTAAATISAPVSSGSFTFEVSANISSPTQYTVNVIYPVPDPQPAPDTTAPTAPTSLTATLGSGTQANLNWQSSTDNVGVAGYDIYRNNVLISSSMTTTYNDVNLAPSTTYTYTVKAKDAANNISAASNSASLTTPTPADTTAPSVSITSPVNGAVVAGTVNIAGNVSDNVGVSKVEVQIDSTGFTPATFSTSATAWSYSLNTNLYPNGSHTIAARATDTAGNQQTTSITVSVQNASLSDPTPPDTQGTWTSPEGARFEIINTVCPVTLAQLYQAIKSQSSGPGDFAKIAPNLKVKVDDASVAQTVASAVSTSGNYISFAATINFKGTPDRGFCLNGAYHPESQVIPHEYGHAWTLYHLYMSHNGMWAPYLTTRWANADGAVKLGEDSRLSSSYSWDVAEIIADDYRRLYATGSGQTSSHLNRYIPDSLAQPGLKNWFETFWKVKQ